MHPLRVEQCGLFFIILCTIRFQNRDVCYAESEGSKSDCIVTSLNPCPCGASQDFNSSLLDETFNILPKNVICKVHFAKLILGRFGQARSYEKLIKNGTSSKNESVFGENSTNHTFTGEQDGCFCGKLRCTHTGSRSAQQVNAVGLMTSSKQTTSHDGNSGGVLDYPMERTKTKQVDAPSWVSHTWWYASTNQSSPLHGLMICTSDTPTEPPMKEHISPVLKSLNAKDAVKQSIDGKTNSSGKTSTKCPPYTAGSLIWAVCGVSLAVSIVLIIMCRHWKKHTHHERKTEIYKLRNEIMLSLPESRRKPSVKGGDLVLHDLNLLPDARRQSGRRTSDSSIDNWSMEKYFESPSNKYRHSVHRPSVRVHGTRIDQ